MTLSRLTVNPKTEAKVRAALEATRRPIQIFLVVVILPGLIGSAIAPSLLPIPRLAQRFVSLAVLAVFGVLGFLARVAMLRLLGGLRGEEISLALRLDRERLKWEQAEREARGPSRWSNPLWAVAVGLGFIGLIALVAWVRG